MKIWHRAALILTAGLCLPGFVDSCGPFLFEAQFTTYHHVLPGAFQSGHPGILRPHFHRADLLVAYRVLSGFPLKSNQSPAALREVSAGNERIKPWLEVRGSVSIKPDKKVPGTDFEEYPNCLAPAFVTAADTLMKRKAQWGESSPEFAEWVKGQDEVFQNCDSRPFIPQSLTAGDPLLIADRKYQIAAAEFYAGQYDQAESDFDLIASDAGSPWHGIAPYLAARACIRAGTMSGIQSKLREAEQRLLKINTASAKDLLSFVQAHTDPAARLAVLGEQLMKPDSNLPRVLTDYTRIWDNLASQGKEIGTANSDVTEWIAKFQSNNGRPAVDIWREKKTLPWLIAALVWTKPGDRDLIEAARAVPADSPGYATATFYGMLMQIRLGETAAAREWASQSLSHKEPDSVINMFRSVRMSLAQNWNEFLKDASRIPVATSDFDDQDGDVPVTDAKESTPALDTDATNPFNTAVPLKLWIEATDSNLLAPEIRGNLAVSGWTRAAVLNDQPAARALADRIRRLKPELAKEMADWSSAKDPSDANFAAVFLMLRAPGLHPVIRAGWQRSTPVMKSDELRDNWWALEALREQPEANHDSLADLYPKGDYGPKGFLTPEQQKAGAAEHAALMAKAASSTVYLCTGTINRATSHPADARLPQALHLCVEATHYGPSDKNTQPLSKRAFEILHRKYPNSEWAARTKYWY